MCCAKRFQRPRNESANCKTELQGSQFVAKPRRKIGEISTLRFPRPAQPARESRWKSVSRERLVRPDEKIWSVSKQCFRQARRNCASISSLLRTQKRDWLNLNVRWRKKNRASKFYASLTRKVKASHKVRKPCSKGLMIPRESAQHWVALWFQISTSIQNMWPRSRLRSDAVCRQSF